MPPPPTPATIFLVDDEPGMLRALTRLLSAEGFHVRGFPSPKAFLEARRSDDEPGCLVLDVALPELDGLELQQRLVKAGVPLPVIFLTGRGDIPMSVRAIKAGAVDFLTKPANDSDLLSAVHIALQRATAHCAAAEEFSALQARHRRLTPREREVMQHVVDGKPNKRIAAELGTGEQNIKIHRGRVMEKMEVASLADLVRAAGKLSQGKP